MPNSKQRREAARRRQLRQAQRRRQREVRRRRFTIIASVVGVLVVIGIVVGVVVATNDDGKKPKAAAGKSATATTSASASASPSTATSSATAASGCGFTKSGTAAKKVTLPSNKPPKTGTVDVTMKTTQGTMVFALNRAAAPCAAENFVSLAQQKYFNATPCHRLVTSGIFVLQCGDPTGSGSGGPGYKFNDELTGKEKYTRGVLAMANSGANTNGSQFFIVYKDSTGLGPQYTIFGTVKTGLSVVDKVAAKGSTPTGDGKPKLPISITSATVAK